MGRKNKMTKNLFQVEPRVERQIRAKSVRHLVKAKRKHQNLSLSQRKRKKKIFGEVNQTVELTVRLTVQLPALPLALPLAQQTAPPLQKKEVRQLKKKRRK